MGIAIGESAYGDNPYNDPDYNTALREHFSLLNPGAYMQASMDIWGKDLADQLRRSTFQDDQILIVGPVFWNADTPYTLKNAPKDEVIAYMDRRVKTILGYVRKADANAKPTYIMFMNEGVWVDPRTGSEEWQQARYNWLGIKEGSSKEWKAGPEEWGVSPYYRVFGNALIAEIYLMIYRAAEEKGLVLGKDYRLLYNDFNNHKTGFGSKINFLLRVLGRSKKKIAESLGIDEADVQLDVGIQGHFFVSNRPWWLIKPPTKDELTEAITLFQEQIGRVHITELNIIGAENQSGITEMLGIVLQVAVETGCDSVTFWNVLRCTIPASERHDIYQVPQGLFDCDYKPTREYDALLQRLQGLI